MSERSSRQMDPASELPKIGSSLDIAIRMTSTFEISQRQLANKMRFTSQDSEPWVVPRQLKTDSCEPRTSFLVPVLFYRKYLSSE